MNSFLMIQWLLMLYGNAVSMHLLCGLVVVLLGFGNFCRPLHASKALVLDMMAYCYGRHKSAGDDMLLGILL
jgi:hypothetical protein